MGVWMSWQASCDACHKPFAERFHSQQLLLEWLRRRGWRYKREPMPTGYTKLVTHCPECATQIKAASAIKEVD